MLSLPLAALCLAAAPADFEAPPQAFQTSASPADGSTVAANPPCFVFPSRERHAEYRVEVSTDATFPADHTVRYTTPYGIHAPSEAYRPGKYYWRWRPAESDGWSPARGFTVAAEVPTVPFPDVDALVRRLGTSRPRVDVTAAALPALRQQALAQFGAGYPQRAHEYAVQMQAAALLPEPAFLPPAGDPKRVELYQQTFQATRPFMGGMVQLAQMYLLTGDELCGREAKRRLLHIVGWDPQGSTSLGHNDEPATDVVRHCPLVYDWVYPLLTPEERRRCLECLQVRMTEMRGRWLQRPFELYPYESHNMGYYLPDLLQASLALVGEAPVEEMLRYTLMQLWSPFYPPYGGADGGWSEGPSYWGWTVGVFCHTYHLVEQATGIPIRLRSHLRNQAWYGLYGNPPYYRMSPFGDGQENAAGNGWPMAQLAALYQNPYAKWYAEAKGGRPEGLGALLFDASAVPAEAPDDLPQGHAFYDVGLAAMHSCLADPLANVGVLLRSCPFGSISHAYADQNTFTLDAFGEPLVIASGYYQLYGHPHHAQWTWTTKASNSVLVDGEGQATRNWDARGHLTSFHTLAAADTAVGDAHEAYTGRLTRFDRRILFFRPVHTGGLPVVVIRDDLAAPKPVTFQFPLHALERMAVDGATPRVTITRGAARCQVDYLAPGGLKFEQTDQFPVQPFRPVPNQWHLTASTTAPAAAAQPLMVFQPYREGEAPLPAQVEPARGGTALRLGDGARRMVVLFRDHDAAEAAYGDLVTDAAAASVTVIDGQVRSAAMFDGTQLARGGAVLLSASAPASVSASGTARRRWLAADAAPGTKLTATVAGRDAWTQEGATMTRAVGAAPGKAPALELARQAPSPFTVTDYAPVQRTVATCATSGPVGVHAVELQVANGPHGPLPVSLDVGGAVVQQVVAPGRTATLALPAATLGGGRAVTLRADEALGGELTIRRAAAQRVYGVNLLPNPSFEDLTGGAPSLWTAGTISEGAEAELSSSPEGRGGGRCLKLVCTKATAGDFGAMLTWPGLPPSTVDRRFRMSCWVKTDAASVAGLQVTSSDWRWWKNTERLKDRTAWAEAAYEFVLPAGADLAHVRLHCHAEQAGAVILVDDVSLVEVKGS